MDQDLEVDSSEYLELERERRELAELLFARGVITRAALDRERNTPRLVAPDGTAHKESAQSSS